ncbi:hypothetical protein Tco_0784641 [Tanacetum coccineum]
MDEGSFRARNEESVERKLDVGKLTDMIKDDPETKTLASLTGSVELSDQSERTTMKSNPHDSPYSKDIDAKIQEVKKINDNAYKIELLGLYNVPIIFNVSDLSPYSGECEDEENSRTSFSQAGEDDAGALDRNVNLVEYLEL